MKKLANYMEFIFLGLVFLSLFLKHKMIRLGEGLSIISLSMFALYYLLSAIYVMLDRERVEKVMRIIYFAGLWTVAFGIIGALSRIFFWDKSAELLMISASASVGVIIFYIFNWNGLAKGELRSTFQREMQPLLLRIALNLLLVLLFMATSHETLYDFFGPHRNDPKYVDLLLDKMENPDDQEKLEAFQKYHETYTNKEKP